VGVDVLWQEVAQPVPFVGEAAVVAENVFRCSTRRWEGNRC
jgi:hypothetical protein